MAPHTAEGWTGRWGVSAHRTEWTMRPALPAAPSWHVGGPDRGPSTRTAGSPTWAFLWGLRPSADGHMAAGCSSDELRGERGDSVWPQLGVTEGARRTVGLKHSWAHTPGPETAWACPAAQGQRPQDVPLDSL